MKKTFAFRWAKIVNQVCRHPSGWDHYIKSYYYAPKLVDQGYPTFTCRIFNN